MSLRRPAFTLLALTVIYAGALVWAESRNEVTDLLPRLGGLLPLLVSAALVSIILRYLRWHRLLRRVWHTLPVFRGFVAYCSGFALSLEVRWFEAAID